MNNKSLNLEFNTKIDISSIGAFSFLLKYILSILIIICFSTCNSSEKKLQGGWLVDKAYYNNNPIIWNLLTNSIELYKDHTCLLPIPYEKHDVKDYDQGKWTAYKSNDVLYLQIKTINIIFNRTFIVSNYRTITDSISYGMLTKATLSSDSLRLFCTKAPY